MTPTQEKNKIALEKLTAKAPESIGLPKRKGSSSNHQFSGAMCQGRYPMDIAH